MGVMQFLVPRRDRIGAEVTQRAYFSGMDEVPWLTRIQWSDQGLTVERVERDSGNFYLPYGVPGHGELMLSTACLRDRAVPYHLDVEIARGTLNRLRNQLHAMLTGGLTPSSGTLAAVQESIGHLSQAVTTQNQPETASLHAIKATQAALRGIDQLSSSYVTHTLGTRRSSGGKLGTLWGINLGTTLPGNTLTAQLGSTFNTIQIPLSWRDIESQEGQRDFSRCDAQIEWARSHGFKVCGGPLLAMDRGSLPDWMYLFGQEDIDSFRACVAEHLQAVVARYRGKVNLWICGAGLNLENELGHTEEERLHLAVLTIDAIRKQDPRAPIVLSIDQPWGAFLNRAEYELSPLHFADALVRADLGLAGLGLEMNIGYYPGGSEPRDPLEFGRQMDRYSMLGLPLLASLTVPSNATPDSRALRKCQTIPFAANGTLTPDAQRKWGEQILPMLLAKQAVQGLLWNQLRDSQPHAYPRGGLFDDREQAKPIVEVLKALRHDNLM